MSLEGLMIRCDLVNMHLKVTIEGDSDARQHAL